METLPMTQSAQPTPTTDALDIYPTTKVAPALLASDMPYLSRSPI